MKKIIIFVLSFFAVLFFVTSCSHLQLNWTNFTAPDGSFTVLLPAKPQEKSADNTSGEMTDISHTYMTGLLQNKYFFAISTDDFGGTNPLDERGMLELNVSTFCTSSGTILADSSSIAKGGLKGMQFSSKNAGLICFGRIFIVNRRLYMVACGVKGETKSTPEVEKFLNSFEILK